MRTSLFFVILLLACSHQQKISALNPHDPALKIRYQNLLATPEWVEGNLLDLQKTKKADWPDAVMQFFRANASLFKIDNPAQELKLTRQDSDNLGFQHLRFARLHHDIPIWNDELLAHINKNNLLYLINGHYHPTLKTDAKAKISPDLASGFAQKDAREKGLSRVEKNTLIWFPADSSLLLAYHLVLSNGELSWDYFVSADNGKIIYRQDRRRF